jgi:hypothetical protein
MWHTEGKWRMTTQTEQYVTVMIETAALRVYGPEYSNGWIVKTSGDIHRCPVDEAYTMVASGKASYPDGIEKLKEMMYQAPIVGRMERLEADLSSSSFQTLFNLTRMLDGLQKAAKKVTEFFITLWDVKEVIVIIFSLVGAVYLMMKTQTVHWPASSNESPAVSQTSPKTH